MSKLIIDIPEVDEGDEFTWADLLHGVASQIEDSLDYDSLSEPKGAIGDGEYTMEWEIKYE